jgi:hypothetical protein
MAAASDATPIADTAQPAAAAGETGAAKPRGGIRGFLSGISALDAAVATSMVALLAAFLTPLLAFATLWLFAFFPWLRPWTPPEERRVSIDNAVVAERRFTLPESGEEVTVVTFDAEAVGYAADPISVATLWLDPVTGMRVEPTMLVHGNLVSSAMTNRSVGWLNVPYPTLPADVQSCLVLRVLLLLAPEGDTDLSDQPALSEPSDRMPLLAYTDSAPFEPYEDGSCGALASAATPEP